MVLNIISLAFAGIAMLTGILAAIFAKRSADAAKISADANETMASANKLMAETGVMSANAAQRSVEIAERVAVDAARTSHDLRRPSVSVRVVDGYTEFEEGGVGLTFTFDRDIEELTLEITQFLVAGEITDIPPLEVPSNLSYADSAVTDEDVLTVTDLVAETVLFAVLVPVDLAKGETTNVFVAGRARCVSGSEAWTVPFRADKDVERDFDWGGAFHPGEKPQHD